jgi:hypothetical protein
MKAASRVACFALAAVVLALPSTTAPAQTSPPPRLQKWENQDGSLSCSGECPASFCCPQEGAAPPIAVDIPG